MLHSFESAVHISAGFAKVDTLCTGESPSGLYSVRKTVPSFLPDSAARAKQNERDGKGKATTGTSWKVEHKETIPKTPDHDRLAIPSQLQSIILYHFLLHTSGQGPFFQR